MAAPGTHALIVRRQVAGPTRTARLRAVALDPGNGPKERQAIGPERWLTEPLDTWDKLAQNAMLRRGVVETSEFDPRELTSCPRCGKARVNNYRFCQSCGFDYEKVLTPKRIRRPGEADWPNVGLGVFVALVGLALSIASYEKASASGGSYFVTWGAVVAGLWWAVKSAGSLR